MNQPRANSRARRRPNRNFCARFGCPGRPSRASDDEAAALTRRFARWPTAAVCRRREMCPVPAGWTGRSGIVLIGKARVSSGPRAGGPAPRSAASDRVRRNRVIAVGTECLVRARHCRRRSPRPLPPSWRAWKNQARESTALLRRHAARSMAAPCVQARGLLVAPARTMPNDEPVAPHR